MRREVQCRLLHARLVAAPSLHPALPLCLLPAPSSQVRYYEAGVWASTDVEAYAYALAVNAGFRVRATQHALHAQLQLPCTLTPTRFAIRRPFRCSSAFSATSTGKTLRQ